MLSEGSGDGVCGGGFGGVGVGDAVGGDGGCHGCCGGQE